MAEVDGSNLRLRALHLGSVELSAIDQFSAAYQPLISLHNDGEPDVLHVPAKVRYRSLFSLHRLQHVQLDIGF